MTTRKDETVGGAADVKHQHASEEGISAQRRGADFGESEQAMTPKERETWSRPIADSFPKWPGITPRERGLFRMIDEARLRAVQLAQGQDRLREEVARLSELQTTNEDQVARLTLEADSLAQNLLKLQGDYNVLTAPPGTPTDDDFTTLIKPIWRKVQPTYEAQAIRSSLSVEFDDPRWEQWPAGFIPDYVWNLLDIAAQRGIDLSTAPPSAPAMERAMRWRNPAWSEQTFLQLVREFEDAQREARAEARFELLSGPTRSALDELSQKCTTSHAGMDFETPNLIIPKLKLENALVRLAREARAEAIEEAIAILHEEGWLGRSEQRVRAIATPQGDPVPHHQV